MEKECDEILENFAELREEVKESAIISFEDFKESIKYKKEDRELDWESDAQSIKEKYAKEFEDSELIDNTGDEKVSSLISKNLGSYAFIPVLIMSVGAFSLLGQIGKNEKDETTRSFFGKWLLSVDNCSFGIYLIHMYFLEQIQVQFSIDTSSIYWRVFAPIIIYSLSLFVCILIDRSGKLKRIIGLK